MSMFTRTELYPTSGFGVPHPALMPSALWQTPRFIACGTVGMQLGRNEGSEVDPGFGYAMDPSNPLTWRGRHVLFT